MARALDSRSRGLGFESCPFRLHVKTTGKLFTHTCLCHEAVYLVLAKGWWHSLAGKVNVGLAESNGLSADCLETAISSEPNTRIEYGTTFLPFAHSVCLCLNG